MPLYVVILHEHSFFTPNPFLYPHRSLCAPRPLSPTSFHFLQEFNDLHAEALTVVLNCINDSESLQVIHRGGGLMRLMEFVLTRNMPEIQSNAVRCITRAAQSCKHRKRQLYFPVYRFRSNHGATVNLCFLAPVFLFLMCVRVFAYTHVAENRKLLHEQNVEKVLVELLSVGDVSVNTAACGAVFAMSFHLASKDSFRDLGTYVHIHMSTHTPVHSQQGEGG